MTRDEILKAAIARYGEKAQMVIAMEEMAELTKELSKFLRGAHNEDAIAEEIADVRIMLDQMEILFDCAGAAAAYQADKVERLRKRLAGGQGYAGGHGHCASVQRESQGDTKG